MDLELVYKAALLAEEAYINPTHNVKSTEWREHYIHINGRNFQTIAIAGTNDAVDWLWNLAIASWDGVKLASYFSAKRILKNFKRDISKPLLVVGHSKAGPTAMYLGKLLEADYCVSLCPTPGFRKREKLKNTVIVIDPDDIVHQLGEITFSQPKCPVILLKNDHKGKHISDHYINHIVKELETMLRSTS